MWPVAKSGKNGAPQIGHDPVSVARPSAEPGPDVARSRERETKPKRMRPPGLNDQRSPLSRGPSGSGKSGKTNNGSTSVETTGHRRCAL